MSEAQEIAEEDRLDGALVFVSNKVVHTTPRMSGSKDLLFFDDKGGEFRNIDTRLFSLFHALNNPSAQQDQNLVESLIKDFKKNLPPGLEEKLITARLRLLFLLNNAGADVMTYECFYHMMNTVERNGGETVSMVTGNADSVMGLTAFQTERMVIAPHGSVMLHATHDIRLPVQDPVVALQEILRMYKEVDRKVQSLEGKREVTHRFAEAIADTKNVYNDVRFTGQELQQWDTAEAVQDVGAMQELFTQETGGQINFADWARNPIACHFLIARLEERALLTHGIHIKFWQEDSGQPFHWKVVDFGPVPQGRLPSVMNDLESFRRSLIAG